MSEMVERVARVVAKHLYELGGFSSIPEGYVWAEAELRRLDVDGVADCVALAELVIREVLVAMREPSADVIEAVHCLGMPPNYPAVMIAAAVDAFARAHGIEMGKGED